VPRAAFPPDPDALAAADAVVPDLAGLTVGVIDLGR
jgi:hypothetical protein